jgi:hypothetical protein
MLISVFFVQACLDDPLAMGQRFNLPLGGGVYDLH